MHNVGQLLEKKGYEVVTMHLRETTLQAAQRMTDQRIGAVVVTRDDGGREVAGIFTERDLMRRVVAEGREPHTVLLHEVMTPVVACCTKETTLNEVRTVMRHERLRHLPVLEKGLLIGIVSLGDLNIVHHNDQEETILYLQQFIYKP